MIACSLLASNIRRTILTWYNLNICKPYWPAFSNYSMWCGMLAIISAMECRQLSGVQLTDNKCLRDPFLQSVLILSSLDRADREAGLCILCQKNCLFICLPPQASAMTQFDWNAVALLSLEIKLTARGYCPTRINARLPHFKSSRGQS